MYLLKKYFESKNATRCYSDSTVQMNILNMTSYETTLCICLQTMALLQSVK